MIIEEFEEQAVKHAAKEAVITESTRLTYGELNAYANRVAHAIIESDTIVAGNKKKKEEVAVLNKRDTADILALTPMQEGMLYHHLKNPRGDLYFEQLCLGTSGRIDAHLFEQAWNFVIQNNEMLRTQFRWQKLKKPVQVVLKEHRLQPRFYDLSGIESSKQEETREEIKLNDRRVRFDLGKVPFRVSLVKLATDTHEIIISNHHILYDGWSSGIIVHEFFTAYDELSKGEKLIREGKPKFKEFVRWIFDRDQGKQEAYWRDYLAGFDTRTKIPVKKTGAKEIAAAANYKLTLARTFKAGLDAFAKKNKLTPAALLYSAYGILLQKYNNSNDVIFGTTVSGRSAKIKGIENIVGLFINTLPLRVASDPGAETMAVLKKINDDLKAREEHETIPLVNIKEYSQPGSDEELFDSIMVIENYPLDVKRMRGGGRFTIDSYSAFEMTNYDLTVAVTLSDEMEIAFIYNEEAFDRESIARLAGHFSNILRQICENSDRVPGKIEMLAADEKRRLLCDFNSRDKDYPTGKTIRQLFTEQVERTPHHIALAGQAKKADSAVSLSYRELDKTSERLAAHLVERGAQANDLHAIMVERSLTMIIGILGILKTGSGYVPLNPKAPAGRNRRLVAECAVKLLLIGRDLSAKARELESAAREIVFIDESRGEWRSPELSVGAHDVVPLQHRYLPPSPTSGFAYVIFTSGSTGTPKGVAISHANFCPLMHWGYERMGLTPGDRVVQNLSYYFDWSVWEIFIALTSGASLHMVSEAVMLSPRDYREFIERNAVTVLHVTPTQFQSLTESNCKLDTLRHLAIGAEKLSFDLVRRAYALVNKRCRVYNMYGPTEATIMAAVLEIERGVEAFYKQLSSMPIGPPLGNCDFLILDKDQQPAPLEVPGELYIAGDGVAAGYLNNPELTAERFTAAPAHSIQPQPKQVGAQDVVPLQSSMAETRLYRTGDMCRWLVDGPVEFIGRIDQQVKIRGFRIEPGEIENRLLSHWAVKEALVVTRGAGEEKYLCAYIVRKALRQEGTEALRQYLSQTLPDYMVPAHFMFIEKIPLNPNGKIDLKALPEPQPADMGREYTAPRDELEEKLARVWALVLDIDQTDVSIDDNFFASGGHSLKAARLLSRIHRECDVEIPLGDIFKFPTIRGLSGYISQKERSKYSGIKPAQKREYYPLSPAQKRLYVLQQMENESRVYNMPGIMEVQGKIEKEKFEYAFIRLIERHESLRTSFVLIDEQAVQKIHSPDDIQFAVEYYDAHTGVGAQDPVPLQEIIDRFIRPFDLSCAPLLRAGLIKIAEEKSILMVDMHHIVSDGSSLAIFIEEFVSIFKGDELLPLAFQYKDYTEWLLSGQEQENIKEQETFWLEQFAGEIPVLNLPNDFPRPAVQSFAGSQVSFQIGQKESAALKELALQENATIYMVLLALFNILLSKLSGQEDIIVGTPIVGRQHIDLSRIIGMFVNTLALRNHPTGAKRFTEFLAELRQRTTAAFEKQAYPFEELVEKVVVKRDASRNPLFDVMLVMQNVDIPQVEVSGLKLSPYDYSSRISKFDMTFICKELERSLHFTIEYSSKLFKKETIKRFANYYKTIISSVVNEPGRKISKIRILPEEEREQVFDGFNRGAEAYSLKTVVEMFEEQVAKTPENIACFENGHYITYKGLNKRADILANIIKEL